MADRFIYDVFLSHNSKDKPWVRKLAEKLRAAGLRVWFDEWVLRPGDDIYLSIERGLKAARAQVLCLSPAALGSEWVTLERGTVLFRDPANAGRRFIPLLLADCDLPDVLRRYKFVDYRRRTKAAFDELLAACRFDMESTALAPNVKATKKPVSEQAKLEHQFTSEHESWVWSVAVSPDETWMVSGSSDKTVKILELETGKCLKTLEGHTRWSEVRRDYTRREEGSIGVRRQVHSRLGCKLRPRIGEVEWPHGQSLVGCRAARQHSRAFRGVRQNA